MHPIFNQSTRDLETVPVPGRRPKKEHRVNFIIAQEVWERLSDVAESKEMTVSDVMRDAIALELWANEELGKGNKILVGNGDGYREVLLP